MLANLWQRLFRRPSPDPPDPRPQWIRDDDFMAWLQAAREGEYQVVTGFGPHAWQEWSEGTWGGPASFAGRAIERCQWRWEGWLGAMPQRRHHMFIAPAGPGAWWENLGFLIWHDLEYPVKETDGLHTAAELGRAVAEDRCTELSGPVYERSKAVRRRYQGWCGMLQLMSGRLVCPKCGGWDIDNLGNDVTALCSAPTCDHEWRPTWPKGDDDA